MTDMRGRTVVFSFIAPQDNVISSIQEQKQTLLKAFQRHKIFHDGELLETMERRAMYPVVHCSTRPQNERDDIELLGTRELEDTFTLRQGIYQESRHYQPSPKNVTEDLPNERRAYIFMGFKSLDFTVDESLENTWKDWTGARMVNTFLDGDFRICRFSFFHRVVPADTELFMYILMIECARVTPANSTQLLDFVQKLRVERVFGYLTVYRREYLTATSQLIHGILSDQEDFSGKVEI